MIDDRTLVIFDYEGTLGTSIRRHYAQYVEALRRIRQWSGLKDAPELTPMSESVFLERYPKAKKVGKLLEFAHDSPESMLARAWLDRTHSEIIWEYGAEYMLLEQLIPGAGETLDAIADHCTSAMVSFTRQDESDFRDHLVRLGLSTEQRLSRDRIHTVGADGASSRNAKAKAILDIYGATIAAQRAAGYEPVMVADAVDDMLAAFDADLGFVGVCTTGKSTEEEFTSALEKERTARPVPSFVKFVPAVGHAQCIELLQQLQSGSAT